MAQPKSGKGNQMNTLEEIQKQIEALQQQAKELIKLKKAEILAEVVKNIKTYGLTAEECGFHFSEPQKATKTKTSIVEKMKAEPMFRGPNGEEWAGGRGAKPKWVKEILEAGGDIEDYRIKKEPV